MLVPHQVYAAKCTLLNSESPILGLFLAAPRGGFHPVVTPPLLAQHMYRVFAQDCRGQFHRRTLNGVEEVLKKRCVHVIVIHVPKQRIDCQKRLGNDRCETHCKSVVERLGNPIKDLEPSWANQSPTNKDPSWTVLINP